MIAHVKTKNPNNNNERREHCHGYREGRARDVEVIYDGRWSSQVNYNQGENA
jgi:hypothetical protein